MRQQKVTSIAIVEDDEAQQELMVSALTELNLADEIIAFKNGAELMEHLRLAELSGQATVRARAAQESVPRMPSLILLDLNLPGRDGREMLREFKSDARLRRIPIIVITGADARQEAGQMYEAGANAFISKPVSPEEFARAVQRTGEFWLRVVQLPSLD